MSNTPPQWLAKPTKRHILLVGLLLLSGILLSILGITDIFTTPIFVRKNILIIFLQLAATLVYIKMVKNYLQKK